MTVSTRLVAMIALIASFCACNSSPVVPSYQTPSQQPASSPVPPVPTPPISADDFAPPKARLVVTVEGRHMPAVLNGRPVLFDASESTGEGLTYRVEYGDGESASESRTQHAPTRVLPYMTPTVARLTVTDRFGRTAVDEAPYSVFRFFPRQGDDSEYWTGQPVLTPPVYTPPTILHFTSQNGLNLSGTFFEAGSGASGTFTGVVHENWDIRLQFSDGRMLEGGLQVSDYRGSVSSYDVSLMLLMHGGTWDGKVVRFSRTSPF